MVDWLGIFQNFGYPALISGALLYIIVYKLEKVTTEIQEIKGELIKLNAALPELRQDVREMTLIGGGSGRRRMDGGAKEE